MRDPDFTNWAYASLSLHELQLLRDWYDDTNERNLIGEMSCATVSVLQAIIGGSHIRRVVQLGTYAGWSSLMLGFVLRRINGRMWTCDIDERMANYTQDWLIRAELAKVVYSEWCSSVHPGNTTIAKAWNRGRPELVIIDASHECQQTIDEMELWYSELEEGGLIVLHDSSELAVEYDKTNGGGVHRAVSEFGAFGQFININGYGASNVFKDPCGCAIIQKP